MDNFLQKAINDTNGNNDKKYVKYFLEEILLFNDKLFIAKK